MIGAMGTRSPDKNSKISQKLLKANFPSCKRPNNSECVGWGIFINHTVAWYMTYK